MGSRRQSSDIPGLAAAVVTVSLWASAFVGIRDLRSTLSPEALTLGRLVVSSLVLGTVAAIRREPLPAKPDLARIGIYGVLWLVVYSVALNQGERHLDAGTAAMLVNTGPLLIALLAGIFLGEGFPGGLFAGSVLAFGGCVAIGLAATRSGFDAGGSAALCLGAAVAYASAVVVQKPVVARVSSVQVTALACLAATVVSLPFAGSLYRGMSAAPASTWLWVVYLGLAPTAVGFVTWSYALRRTTAGRLASTIYLVPPLAILIGWAWLHEVSSALALAGGGVCLAGVALARGSADRRLAGSLPAWRRVSGTRSSATGRSTSRPRAATADSRGGSRRGSTTSTGASS